jgi:fucose permease
VTTSSSAVQPVEGAARPGAVAGYLFLAYGSLAFCMGFIPALATAFRDRYGLSGAQLANVHNAKDLGLIGAMLVGPALLRRFGPLRTTHQAVAGALVGCAVFTLPAGYPGVLAGAFLHGASFSLGLVATVTCLFRLPPGYRRLAALAATFGVSSCTAPALVGLLVHAPTDSARLYLLFAAELTATLAVAAVLARGGLPDPDGGDPTAPMAPAPGRYWWLVPVAGYALLMAQETLVVSWATYLGRYRLGMSLAEASALLALLWLVYTPARLAGDTLARRFGARLVVLTGTAVAALGALLMATGGPAVAVVAAMVFALGAGPIMPVYQAALLAGTPVARHAALNSALGAGSAVVTTAAVWLTGLSVDRDARMPFLTAVALMVLVLVWFARGLPGVVGGRRGTVADAPPSRAE